jgi:hypothetical protein
MSQPGREISLARREAVRASSTHGIPLSPLAVQVTECFFLAGPSRIALAPVAG